MNMDIELVKRTAQVAGLLAERYPNAQIQTRHDMNGCVGFMWSERPAKNTVTAYVTQTQLRYAIGPDLIADYVMRGWPKP